MSTRRTTIFQSPNVAKHLSRIHNKYVGVLADNALNNIVFLIVCKSHYIDYLIEELGIDNSLGNPTHTPDDTYERVNIGQSVMCSFEISTEDEELDLPSLYWIPKLLVSLQTLLYCWICQMPHEILFQIINIYSISGPNQTAELLWHELLKGCCELDVSFAHCVVCPSVYGFWLPLWYLQTSNLKQ